MNGRPLVFFVHTPKTAGSTINATLTRFGPGEAHIERYLETPRAMKRTLKKQSWVSGHIGFDDALALVTDAKRPAKFFSSVRDPMAQVRSHLNWLLEIRNKTEDFFQRHPEHIKAISEDLSTTDLANADALIASLQRYKGLFLNNQSRFVLGANFNWSHAQIDRHLEHYEFVAHGGTVETLLSKISPGLTSERRENVSRYNFDPSAFQSDQVHDWLRINNALDHQLFAAVKRRFT